MNVNPLRLPLAESRQKVRWTQHKNLTVIIDRQLQPIRSAILSRISISTNYFCLPSPYIVFAKVAAAAQSGTTQVKNHYFSSKKPKASSFVIIIARLLHKIDNFCLVSTKYFLTTFVYICWQFLACVTNQSAKFHFAGFCFQNF